MSDDFNSAKLWYLVTEAYDASEAVDDFDLVSSDPESSKAFDGLLEDCELAKQRLITFILENYK